jgi:signal transduction histidine kinase
MAAQIKVWQSLSKIGRFGTLARQKISALWQQCQPFESADYLAWRHRFLTSRVRLCLWVAVPCFITVVIQNFHQLFFDAQEFDEEIIRYFGNPDLPDRVRQLTVVTNFVIGVLLTACLIFQRTRWGQRYPAIVFLCFSWLMTLTPQIVGTHMGLPDSGGGGVWFLVFLAQATLIPVHWRLHLASQLGAFAYYVGVNPLLGTTTIEGKSIYSTSVFIYLFWFCFICDLAVYLYERLQRAEFESRRELRVFLHAVSHDLRTPVMGTSIVLHNLLKKAGDSDVVVSKTVLERLLQGSNRQLSLIHSLLEAHEAEVQTLVLHRQPLQLRGLANSVLADLEPALTKNHITTHNCISPNLPDLDGDATQLWRVYSNLITNAIKHNPHGVEVTLGAEILHPERWHNRETVLVRHGSRKTQLKSPEWLCAYVQDNGIGIPVAQQERLFELYARGNRARYMPGLGLGLYLCRQIITAHGGEMGVVSQPGAGARFWFTLPIAAASVASTESAVGPPEA